MNATPSPNPPTPLLGTATTAPLPAMTKREANWQVHVAGLNAGAAAEAAGIDRETTAQLLDATTGITIAGIHFPPIHAGLLMMLPLLDGLRGKVPSLTSEGGQLAALAFCLGQPTEAWTCLRATDNGTTFEAAAFAYANQFTLSDLRQLTRWMTSQMAQLNESGEESGATAVGKPETSAAPPPASPSSPSA